MICQGRIRNLYGDLTLLMLVINDTEHTVRFSDAQKPLTYNNTAVCSVNGVSREFYSLFSNMKETEAGMRSYMILDLPVDQLGSMGISSDQIQTLDFMLSVFPDADQLDYEQYPVHIDIPEYTERRYW